jgi:arylsulfatase A-like enzyme
MSVPWKKMGLFLAGSILGCISSHFFPKAGLPSIPEFFFLIGLGLTPFCLARESEERSNLFFLWESDLLRFFRSTPSQSVDAPSFRFENPTPEEKRRFTLEMRGAERPHVIFLFLESFRAKNIGALGGSPGFSPEFDKWSKEGILFSQFHSNGLLTSSAMISSLFGILPMFHPTYLRSYLPIPLRGIPQILQTQGYENGMILGGAGSFQSWERFFEKNGFQEIIGKSDLIAETPEAETTSWGVHDEWIYKKALSWLITRKKPAFLTLLSATCHHPWLLPNSWKGRGECHPYFQTFSYADWALGRWLEALEKSGLMEKSLIFIFGDHGQELGERGQKSLINRHVYQENIHVPLLLLAKGKLKKPLKLTEICSQVDLLPTLLDLLKLGSTHHGMGESLLLNGRTKPHFFLHPFQESFAAVRAGPWKGILNRTSGKLELYHLENDPEEKEDLRLFQPDLARWLREKIILKLDALNSLYATKSFAPRQTASHAFLHLDYSGKDRLTETQLKELEDQGDRIRTLNFSHRLFVNDPFISRYSIFWPRLTRLDLSHCLLVTNSGVERLIHSCPKLEELSLCGLDEFTASIDAPSPHLRLLNLLQCRSLNPSSTIRWLQKLRGLTDLGLNGENFSACDWNRLTKALPPVMVLFLENALQLKPGVFLNLLSNNIYLKYLTLEKCPEITDECLIALKNRELRSLCLTSCPKVTSRTLDALLDLPLQKIFLKDCPSIAPAAIERWRRKGTTLVSTG